MDLPEDKPPDFGGEDSMPPPKVESYGDSGGGGFSWDHVKFGLKWIVPICLIITSIFFGIQLQAMTNINVIIVLIVGILWLVIMGYLAYKKKKQGF